MSDILGGLKTVFGGALAIGAALVVFWIVGIISTPGTSGLGFMAGVGVGIKATLSGLATLAKNL